MIIITRKNHKNDNAVDDNGDCDDKGLRSKR